MNDRTLEVRNLNVTIRGGHFSEFDVQNVAGKIQSVYKL